MPFSASLPFWWGVKLSDYLTCVEVEMPFRPACHFGEVLNWVITSRVVDAEMPFRPACHFGEVLNWEWLPHVWLTPLFVSFIKHFSVLIIYCFFGYFAFLSDSSTLGIWRQASDLGDISLYSQVPQFLELVLASSAPNTLSKYSSGWNRWRAWAKSKVAVPHLPAQPLHIPLYILGLTNSVLELGHGSSVLDTALYSIYDGDTK